MSKKIFELAKELGKSSLDLVEELKEQGFNVRNHMTALSDDEVEKVLTLFKPKEEVKKKTSKKKATVRKKKKVVKKVVKKSTEEPVEAEVVAAATAAVAETVPEEVEEDSSKKSKTVITRKKTVVRKKTSDKEKNKAADDESLSTQSSPLGLRVIARPEAPKTEEVREVKEEVTSEEAPKQKEEKKLYKEKVHRFTPVFIPEKSESDEEEDAEKKKVKTAAEGAEGGEDEDDDSKKEGASKKRIGGLASMMSGKKHAVSKSQILTQDRADNELKSYAALSSSGRPLYTQVKKKRIYTGSTQSTEITEVKDSKRVIKLHDGAYVEELAKKLKIKLKDMIDKVLDINLLVKTGDYVGINLASEIASLYEYRVENVAFDEDELIGKERLSEEEKEKLPLRDPIITIMGHVDHGKTTLLDYIREAKVVEGEAGGITQHIGAYSVDVNGKTLTFLDTPGHAAFASMRQRGADVTDIVVLVVAADDGVMPQTRESIRFCQNANVPIIVAVNKMDKEGANPDRVKSELAEMNITPEDWGGETQFVHISALKGDGVDNLLESIALQSEMMELRADPKGNAEGAVIESKIEQGRGPVATILVQKGTLKKGDSVVVGETYGRARTLTNSFGKQLNSAGPSLPVQILGLSEAPSPGDIFNVVKNEREAKKIAENRINERKELENTKVPKKLTLEDFFAQASGEGQEQKTLNLIVRSDVQGSYEAIKQALEGLSNKEVEVKIIAGGVGAITDNDVLMASSSMAIIIGFNMRPISTARRIAEDKGVEIKTYSIIYELIDDVKMAIEGMLEPEFVEEFIGRAEVKETFSVPKVGVIAGSSVTDGKITDMCNIRLLRNGKIVFDGKLSSLKRFKDDVKEVKNGYECGIGLLDFNDIKINDIFEAYMMQERKRKLEDVVASEG